MKRTDIEKIFAGIEPSPALEIKVMRLGYQEKPRVRRRMLIPVVISVVAALALITFGIYALLPKVAPANQALSQVFTVQVCAANGTQTDLTQESTVLMAYTDPGLPLTLKTMDVQATHFQVHVNEGTIWTGNLDAPVARGNACVLSGEETLYWSAKLSDGSYAPSGLVSISAYKEDELMSEIVISIREIASGGYAAKVIEGVTQVDTEDGSVYLEGKVSDLVYIDAPVFGTTELGVQTADVYSAMREPVLVEPYIDYFGKGRVVMTHKTFDESQNNIINGESFPTCFYDFTNGDHLFVAGVVADFTTLAGAAIAQSIQQPSIPCNGGTDQEWDFASKKEAFAAVKSALKQMGITISDQYQVCAFDYLALERKNLELQTGLTEDQLASEARNLRTNWSEDDNCYYFILRQDVNGTPMSDQSYGRDMAGEFSSGAVIRAIYTKDGIVSLGVLLPYKIGSVEMNDAATISLDDALAMYADVRAESKSGAIQTIMAVEYVYLPVAKGLHDENGFDLIPCWALGVRSSWSWDGPIFEWYFVNAMTGEIYESILEKSHET